MIRLNLNTILVQKNGCQKRNQIIWLKQIVSTSNDTLFSFNKCQTQSGQSGPMELKEAKNRICAKKDKSSSPSKLFYYQGMPVERWWKQQTEVGGQSPR